jgi:transcriptional regulator with XRE-family HTH domain
MERIRQLRKAKGLSQAKLAVMADMDPATLNRLEQGKGNPNIRTLERVAGALGVEVADLLGKASAPPSLEPSFNDVLDDERRIAAIKRFEENLRHFTGQWREELKDPQKQGRYWCVGVQATAIGLTELISKLDLFRRIGEVGEGSPSGLIPEIKKGRNGRAMSDPEFVAAMDLLTTFHDMHKAADEALEADAAAEDDWLAREEAAQRRKAFSVIQGEMTA